LAFDEAGHVLYTRVVVRACIGAFRGLKNHSTRARREYLLKVIISSLQNCRDIEKVEGQGHAKYFFHKTYYLSEPHGFDPPALAKKRCGA
jgi:hypothetical protein